MAFTAQNVRCFRDEARLTLAATRMAEPGAARSVASAGAACAAPALPAAGIFGANASGKTALLAAMADMASFASGAECEARPFLLDAASAAQPSRYEIELILEGVRWRYGFEIAPGGAVVAEHAFHYPHGRRASVFHRHPAGVAFGPRHRSAGSKTKAWVRPDTLTLPTAAAVGLEAVEPLNCWFETNLRLVKSSETGWGSDLTAVWLDDPATAQRAARMLEAADLGIVGADIGPLRTVGGLTHSAENFGGPGSETLVALPMKDQSSGTRAWLELAGPVLSALDRGDVLLIDELGRSLHPHLLDSLVGLFQNQHTNPRCAQLIFSTHTANVLGDTTRRRIGRDQVWFTQKAPDGASKLYPLTDFSPRQDEAVARRYLQGRYGAVPSCRPAR